MFVLTIVITFGAFVSGQGLNTGLSVYIDHIGGTATFAGMLSAVFSIAAAVSRLVIGPAIDTRGSMVIMVAGSAALAVGTLLPGLAPSEATLVIGRIVQGAGFAASTTAAATAAADVLPSARMGEGIGYYGLGQALATSVGPAFALFLISTDPAENLFFVLAAVAAVVVALSAACRYERHPELLPEQAVYRIRAEEERAREEDSAGEAATTTGSPTLEDAAISKPSSGPTSGSAAAADSPSTANTGPAPASTSPANTASASPANTAPASIAASDSPSPSGSPLRRLADRIFEPGALPGAIPLLVLSAAFGFSIVFVGLYGTEIGIGNAGVYYTFSAVSMIAIRLKSKSFMDAMLPIKTFAIAIVCGVASFSLLLVTPVFPPVFYLAGLLYGICLGIGLPLNQSIAVKNTPPERWGAGNALFLLASDIGISLAAVVWGVTNDAFGFGTTIVLAMGCMVASFLLALAVYPEDAKRRRPKAESKPRN